MSVGAVGGVGAAAGGMTGAAATGLSGAASAGTAEVAGPTTGKSNPVTSIADLEINGSVQQQDFNSIDLLIALLLLAAGKGKDDEDSCGSAALGFLAGLAMAGSLGRMDFQFEISGTLSVESAGGAEAGGGTGGGLDVSA